VRQSREVGADRIVNAVAAIEEHKEPLILIDFGTATTFDYITAKIRNCGGVIVPGIQLSADALFEKLRKTAACGISRRRWSLGTTRSTTSAPVHLWVCRPRGWYRSAHDRRNWGAPARDCHRWLATVIAGIARRIDEVDSLLTLKGLKVIYNKNERGAA